MAPRTPTDVNYAVLRRYLPRLHEILTIATYAHIYVWSSTSNSWSKAGFEGSLFLVSLNPPSPSPEDSTPKTEEYMLFLLNRCSLHNWHYHLRSPDNVDLENGDFCILRANDPITNGPSNGNGASTEENEELAYGLFIFSEQGTSTAEDKEKFLRMMKECATTYQATSAAAALPTPVPQPEPQQTQAGRSISLTELFQPRDVQPLQQPMQQQHQGYYTQPGWGYQDMGIRGQQLPPQQQQQIYYDQPGSAEMGMGAGNGGGGDVLMNLFQKASNARYMGGGGPPQGY